MLKQRIKEVTDKSTVTISKSSFGSTDGSYTLEEIIELESKERTRFKSGNTFVIHILYLNGEYNDNDQTLGLAYSGTSFVMFKDIFTPSLISYLSLITTPPISFSELHTYAFSYT